MKHTTFRRAMNTGAAVTASTAVLLLAGVTAASAHVGVTPDKTEANSYALLTFAVPHGCEGSPTTKVTITLPEQIDQVTPTVNPNWTVAKVTEKLAQPKKLATRNSITERTSKVVYTAKTPLPDGYRDTLVLSLKVPDAAGTTLIFPTLQNCEKGQTDWSQVAKEGQDPETLDAPAPSFEITAASATSSEHGTGHGTDQDSTATAATSPASTDDGGASGRSWAGLLAGLAGLVMGGAALFKSVRSRRAAGATSAK
ncbi:YcnI family protein [Pseudarthrobacter sp. J1738]|uniref:YcnI family copper-binding membrane protein n=1 Tax=Pseudarthrobacter sp. J1738 TaxID=3420446 RepID=UPI003D2D2260